MFIYYNKNKQIKMRSDEKLETILFEKEVNFNDVEKKRFEENDGTPHLKNNKIVFEGGKSVKEDLKLQVENAKTINELKEIIKKLI